MKTLFLTLLVLLVACSGEYDVRIAFDRSVDDDRITRVQVAVVEDCSLTELEGDLLTVVRSLEFAVDATAAQIGELPAGNYGLIGRAWGEDCRLVAAGCRQITVEDGGEGLLGLTLPPFEGARCAAGQRCEASECAGDASDASALDSSTDAGGDAGDGGVVDASDTDTSDSGLADATESDAGGTGDGGLVDTNEPDGPNRAPVWDSQPSPVFVEGVASDYEMTTHARDPDMDSFDIRLVMNGALLPAGVRYNDAFDRFEFDGRLGVVTTTGHVAVADDGTDAMESDPFSIVIQAP